MKRVRVTRSDEVAALIDAYQRDQPVAVPLSTFTETALRQYLRLGGYHSASTYRPPRMTPLAEESGISGGSIEHDRYLYDLDNDEQHQR